MKRVLICLVITALISAFSINAQTIDMVKIFLFLLVLQTLTKIYTMFGHSKNKIKLLNNG